MGAVAIASWANRLWAFVRREWPLCVFAVAALYLLVSYYDHAPGRIACLIGLAGGLICLKRFHLDHCLWLYALAALLTLPTTISLEDAKELRAAYAPLRGFELQFIYLVVNATHGMLASIPFSLFLIRKSGGFSALWKIPLCIFFVILALEPFFITLAAIILMSFTTCP